MMSTLGLHMICEGLQAIDPTEGKSSQHSFIILAITAFSSSIDAIAVGVSLAFIGANIIGTATAIGLAIFAMVTLGVMLGLVLGLLVGAC